MSDSGNSEHRGSESASCASNGSTGMEFTKVNGTWNGNCKPIETFPMQVSRQDNSVPLVVAEEAYKEYSARYGKLQTLKRLGERGGFGASEIATLLYHRCLRLSEQAR